MAEFRINRFRQDCPAWESALIAPFRAGDPLGFHRTLPGYRPTPLVPLTGLAEQLGLGAIFVKDEAHRLGLNAFKVLGGSYAACRALKERWETVSREPFGDRLELTADQRQRLGDPILCTATDGNHGRGVAWTARRLGLKAVIYMPHGTVPARIENIRREGAEVRVIDGNYDAAVEQVKADAAAYGWLVISDTSWPGYTRIPGWIQSAYTTIFREMEHDLHRPDDPGVDIVLVPGGVGALAAAAAWYYVARYGTHRPELVCVEPLSAACLLASARTADGTPVATSGALDSIMAGLNCGTPSTIAWPLIRDTFGVFLGIEDRYAEQAMRQYHHAQPGDASIVSGESGASGLAALLALIESDDLALARQHLALGPQSRVLLLNTEGATDPESYARNVGTNV